MIDLKKLNQDGYSYTNVVLDNKVLKSMQSAISCRVDKNIDIKLKNDNFMMVNQPFLIKPFLDVALMDQILMIPFLFFQGREFYLGTCNLRRSVSTKVPETTTTLYHRDRNLGSLQETKNNFLKVFIYLTDVGLENGPFTYCAGSQNKVLENLADYRVPDKTVADLYPNKEVFLTGSAGTILTANTTGLHKGTKVREGYRDMFTINYCTTPEKGATNFIVKKEQYKALPEQKQTMCKYLGVR